MCRILSSIQQKKPHQKIFSGSKNNQVLVESLPTLACKKCQILNLAPKSIDAISNSNTVQMNYP